MNKKVGLLISPFLLAALILAGCSQPGSLGGHVLASNRKPLSPAAQCDSTAVAIAKNQETGNYEAFRLAVVCSQ